ITVDPASVGGKISGSTTVCSGTNTTTLTLTGYRGSISWQSATLSGNFTTLSGQTAASYIASGLTSSMRYRAIVKSGACTSVLSDTATILVDSVSLAGTISGVTSICKDNSTSLSLSGYRGTIQWQASLNGTNFTNIASATAAVLNTGNLSTTTHYRAYVSNGVCSADTTSVTTVTVNPVSVAGTISGTTTICSGTSTQLALNGSVGTIQWQESANGSSFTNISNATLAIYTTASLTAARYYRAVVTSGVCSADTTPATLITITPVSVAGTLSGDSVVCKNGATQLSVSGSVGTLQWQRSTGGAYTDIAGETSASLSTGSLTQNTSYRVVVTNGVCSADTSAAKTVVVNEPSIAGTVSGAATICSGTSTTLQLTGNRGSVQW
ncbi:MAG: hypothetical protein ACKO6K_07915, partial [Chitinophagaceae bacterium]